MAIRAAIASQAAANVNALPSLSTPTAEYSNPINPPMLLVFPRPPAVKFGITLGEGQLDAGCRPLSPTEFTFKGALVVAKADLMSNVQDYLDQWLGAREHHDQRHGCHGHRHGPHSRRCGRVLRNTDRQRVRPHRLGRCTAVLRGDVRVGSERTVTVAELIAELQGMSEGRDRHDARQPAR